MNPKLTVQELENIFHKVIDEKVKKGELVIKGNVIFDAKTKTPFLLVKNETRIQ